MKGKYDLVVTYSVMEMGTMCIAMETVTIKDLTFTEVAALVAAFPKQPEAKK